MANKNSTIFIEDTEQVLAFVDSRSDSMTEYIKNSKNRFTLWCKNLTHSDLTNRGKRNGAKEQLSKNYLYYLSVDEMEKIQEQFPDKQFESAKQSNIGLPMQFYEDIGIPRLERREGKQTTQHKHIVLNEYVDVSLVNDTIEYFTQDYTLRVLKRLNKYNKLFNNKNDVILDKEKKFTSIRLTQAIHGLGTAEDVEFHKLRLSMFLNDSIIFVIEHGLTKKRLFILLEKNPRFFTLVGETDTAWEKYIETQRRQEKEAITGKKSLETNEDEKSRRLQSAWKDKLAKEMMSFCPEEGKVFCPLTGIKADFNSFSMLFVASHIKRHADCVSETESFDVNNGLLLSANADALFDKHMITIDENKEVEFSFLLKTEYELCNKLLLNQPVFKLILNDDRMKYLAEHRKIFQQKEEERKKSVKV